MSADEPRAEGHPQREAPAAAPKPVSSSSRALPSSSDDSDGNSYTISQTLFDTLSAKGFSENAIKKSIVSGCVDESTCTQWIRMHDGHPDLDTPLEDGVEVTIKAKRVLTEAEREAKIQELKERIQHKKEEEKEELQRKERERIEMGRKMAHMKTEMEEVRRKMDAAAAQREKAADIEARRRIKIQIAADKLERKGHSKEEAYTMAEREFEEAVERGRAEAAEKLAKLQATAAAASSHGAGAQAGSGGAAAAWDLSAITASASAEANLDSVFAGAMPESAVNLVASIRAHEPAALAHDCVRTLRLILTNVVADPFDIKKRTLPVRTKAFKAAILPVPDAIQLLRWCGFDLSTDANGAHSICLSTVVLRKLRHALSLLGE